jgi:CBS domain-containing protein
MHADPQAIRTREILDDDGLYATDSSVFCPIKQQSVSLGRCDDCQRCDGMQIGGRAGHVLCRAPSRHPARLTIGQAMTGDVVCVTRDVTLFQIQALLLERGISGVPVVDEDGFPIGIVSKTDLLRARFERRDADATAGDLMMPLAFTLAETQAIEEAAALMATEGVHRVPVVDQEGRVVGILTSLDIVRKVADRAFELG